MTAIYGINIWLTFILLESKKKKKNPKDLDQYGITILGFLSQKISQNLQKIG